MSAALKLKNVSLRSRGQLILDSVSWELEENAFVGLIGPNGAGKTVLLKVILGLIQPSEGTVEIFGRRPADAKGLVSYVPQYARFDADFPISVMEVVLMGRLGKTRNFGSYTKEDRAVALGAMEKLSLTDLAQRQIGKLSGGQLQRVLIARALAHEPKILLLDEPTASLDTRVGSNVYELLDELSKSMTIVLVSHDVGVISAHVRSIACMNRKLHYHGTKEVSGEILSEVYGCPIELIAHGHAHRVLSSHGHGEHE